MTPEQKIRVLIIEEAYNNIGKEVPSYPCENIDELFDEDDQMIQDEINDATETIREGEEETKIPAPYSRHYESKSVASKMPDGNWVGFTYWFGGGKYGEPEAIDWIEDAYNLDCIEEEKVMVVRTFSKK